MNKNFVFIILLAIIILGGIFFYTSRISSNTQDNIPPTPTVSITEQSPSPTEICDGINIQNPKPGETITSPLSINVIVDNRNSSCSWTVFEAQAGTVVLRSLSGQILTEGVLTTTEEWMTEGPINFSTTIEFKIPTDIDQGVLIINEENPSGIPDEASSISIPVKF